MIEGPIQTNNSGLVFYFDAKGPKSYVGEPTTNIWSVQAGTNINSFNGWGMPNGGTASITSAIVTNYGTWNGNTIWLVTVGSGTLVSYGSWRLCVDQPTAGSAYPSTRRVAAKIRMLTGSITNIGLHSGGGTGGHNASDFTSILEKNVPSDCIIKDGWVQMLSDASWSSTTVGHCVGIGLNNSGPYSFLVTEPMYYPNNRLVNFTPTSRSNTQGLLDLTGNYTIDLTNAAYDSSSKIYLSGSKAIKINSNSSLFSNAFTWSAWHYIIADGGTGYAGIFWAEGAIAGGSGYQYLLSYRNLGSNAYAHYRINNATTGWGNTDTGTLMSSMLNKWIYTTWTFNNGTTKIYINGVLSHTDTSRGAYNGGSDSPIYIGARNDLWGSINGYIDLVSYHNRVLTDAEILKNFNSQRSRYSV